MLANHHDPCLFARYSQAGVITRLYCARVTLQSLYTRTACFASNPTILSGALCQYAVALVFATVVRLGRWLGRELAREVRKDLGLAGILF